MAEIQLHSQADDAAASSRLGSPKKVGHSDTACHVHGLAVVFFGIRGFASGVSVVRYTGFSVLVVG